MRSASRWALGCVIGATLGVSVSAGPVGAATQYPAQSAAFASKVLNEATLPPESQPTTIAVTQHLTVEPNPIFPHNADGQTYDADQLYTVPTPPTSVVKYLEHHLPKGWKVGLTEPPSGPPPPGETIIQVQVPVSGPHEETALVSYKVVPDGKGSEFRIDAVVTWLPSRSHGFTAPRSGLIIVTGYTYPSNAIGSTPQKSTKVRVSGKKAKAIRDAFDDLPLSTPSDCKENSSDFALTFLPKGSKKSALWAAQASCPSPGVVLVGTGERTSATLASTCALTRAVVSVLPAGKAHETRQAAAQCSSR